MKTIIAAVLLVAFAFAEPPPSNSYLPPSSGSGFPQGQDFAPQVIAARSQEPGARGTGAFARNNPHTHGNHGQDHQHSHAQTRQFGSDKNIGHGSHGNQQARFGAEGYESAQGFGRSGSSGYDVSARNALEQANAEPANYNFGYMVNDYQEGTDFGHHEERQEERAEGEYHVVLPDGRKQTVSYEADERGFKPRISYEDSDAQGRSGYDSNAQGRSGYDSNAQGRSGFDSNAQGRSGYSKSQDHGGHNHGNQNHAY